MVLGQSEKLPDNWASLLSSEELSITEKVYIIKKVANIAAPTPEMVKDINYLLRKYTYISSYFFYSIPNANWLTYINKDVIRDILEEKNFNEIKPLLDYLVLSSKKNTASLPDDYFDILKIVLTESPSYVFSNIMKNIGSSTDPRVIKLVEMAVEA